MVQAQPSFVPARLDPAELYVAAQQSDLAQEQIDQARRLDPKNVRAGLVEMKLDLATGKLDRAEQQCGVLERLSPSDSQVYALCGLAEIGEKKYPAVEPDYRQALGLAPNSAER